MGCNTAGLREHAYVLWDLDRLERCKMLDKFELIPTEPSHMYSEEYIARMEKSIHERYAIWQKGGSGYWSEGDASRVIWPEKLLDRV
jgi:hypothetical protein